MQGRWGKADKILSVGYKLLVKIQRLPGIFWFEILSYKTNPKILCIRHCVRHITSLLREPLLVS